MNLLPIFDDLSRDPNDCKAIGIHQDIVRLSQDSRASVSRVRPVARAGEDDAELNVMFIHNSYSFNRLLHISVPPRVTVVSTSGFRPQRTPLSEPPFAI